MLKGSEAVVLPEQTCNGNVPSVKSGCGFTVIVKFIGAPVQPNSVGVTVNVLVIGPTPVLVAVKEKFPVPFGGAPVAKLSFDHVYTGLVPAVVVKFTGTVAVLHCVANDNGLTSGVCFTSTVNVYDVSQIPLLLIFIALGALVIAGVVVVTEAERPIPVTYAKQVRGMKVYGGGSTYIPLRVNQAGVIPIIFALSILLFPQMIGNFMASATNPILSKISHALISFSQTSWLYAVLYFVLVFLFTYFYTAVTFDPEALSTNLQKNGAFIPGIRPGASTSVYISKVLNRITLLGAIFLGLIAVLPLIVRAMTGITAIALGGTALLIVVSVVLDLIKKIDAQISMREY